MSDPRNKPLILLVDDEANFREIFSTKLIASGFDVAVAKNEQESLRELEKIIPDLILMDINMPGGSGTDAALAIKQNEKTRGIKTAFLTSTPDPWPRIAGDGKSISVALGVDDFLEKTEDLEIIVNRVKKLLERK